MLYIRDNWKVILLLSIISLLALYDVFAAADPPPTKDQILWSTYEDALLSCADVWIEDGQVYGDDCR